MRPTRVAAAVGFAAALGGWWYLPASAHLSVISPYTFNRDAQPIFQERCGACHADGGVSGMPLLRFEDARAATWPIRQALASGRMPPWFAEGATPFKSGPRLSAKELDVLMMWSTGGGPQGNTSPRLVAPPPAPGWALGSPDVVFSMPEPFMLDAGRADAEHEVTLAAPQLAGRFIRAADLLPGSPSIVRSADIIVRSTTGDQTMALWQPGDTPQPLAGDAAIRIPRDASIVLRVRYRRAAGQPAEAIADRSQIGLYFAGGTPRLVRTIDIGSAGHRVERTIRAVALRPISGPLNAWVHLTLIASNGSRTPLARIQLRHGWARRYVFTEPVRLQGRSRIEAEVIPLDGGLWTRLTGELPFAAGEGGPLRLALEVVD